MGFFRFDNQSASLLIVINNHLFTCSIAHLLYQFRFREIGARTSTRQRRLIDAELELGAPRIRIERNSIVHSVHTVHYMGYDEPPSLKLRRSGARYSI